MSRFFAEAFRYLMRTESKFRMEALEIRRSRLNSAAAW